MALASRVDAALAGWVHPRLAGGGGAALQVADFRRMLVSAFLLLFALPLVLLAAFSPLAALACGAAGAALPLIVAAVLSGTGSRHAAGVTALVLAALAIAALAGVSGGVLSPFAAWAGAVPLAAALLGRSRRWFAAGLAAGVAACAMALIFATPAPVDSGVVLAAGLPLVLAAAYALARLSIVLERRLARRGAPRKAGTRLAAAPLDSLAGLVTLHDLKGNVLEVHGAGRSDFGEWLRQPMGSGFYRHIHVADRLAFMQAVDRIRQGERNVSLELRMHVLRAGGEADRLVHLHTDLAAVAGPEGEPLIMAQSRDVTARVDAALTLERRAKTAEKANASKTRFLTAVTHELRTPLNAIIGFSEALAEEYFGALENDRQREYVGLIHQSGKHLLSLVNSMLDMADRGRTLRAFARDVRLRRSGRTAATPCWRCRPAARACILTSRLSRGCGELMADRRAVDQILINLVANAIKFTEKGGVVNIDADRWHDRLRLSVSDTGIGIPADNLELIGQPFVRAEPEPLGRGEGTGLGLSLVKGLVALHGGAFTIRAGPAKARS